ncbi:MAG TPA: HAMP domain-containing sensor histidine kinase [Gemmataceae bacterium]|jgi:signal transduction histidine kinase|nr:HAMP domain-containing sensor histidine kinase [Gemmataceae bacterium]
MEVVHDFGPRPGAAPTPCLPGLEHLLACFQEALGHDLPNLLVAAQGLARVVLEDQGPRLDAQGRHLLERVAALSREADGAVRTLAEVVRACREPPPPGGTELEEVARDAVAAAELLPGGASIGYDFPKALPPLNVPRRALYQVLVQLLRNACQAGVAGRPLRVRVGGRQAEGGAEVWVEDDGRGLTPAQQHELTEALAGRRGATGPGWGLFLVRQVAAAWGGAVRVWSEPGRGTRVALLLRPAGCDGREAR